MWCYLFPVFSLLSKGNVPRWWGEPDERVEPRRVHLQLRLVAAVIWTEESLPTFTWMVARGDLEVCRYKALLRQVVLPSEIVPEIPISLVPGLFEQVLTHGIKLCNAYCISSCSRPLWLLLISAHASAGELTAEFHTLLLCVQNSLTLQTPGDFFWNFLSSNHSGMSLTSSDIVNSHPSIKPSTVT